MENKLQKDETKYYIPQIEEFYIGFEYEYKRGFMDGCVKTKEEFDAAEWIKDKIETTNSFPYIQRVFDGKNNENGLFAIRVKCLDCADIKELGWEESPDEPEEWFWAYKGNSELQLYIGTIPEIGGIQGVEIFNQFDLCFRGYIKNKSELKCLMAQLDIN